MGVPALRSTRLARRVARLLVELPLPCCAAPLRRESRGRINSLFPPYSTHSQWAAAIIVSLTLGVQTAARLPGVPQPALDVALRAWHLLASVWGVLLVWLLVLDPRARAPEAQETLHRCRHGCICVAAPRTKHCRQCDKCVGGFDHHCHWLNTCVGSANYRPWLAFVASLFAWVIVGGAISWTALIPAFSVRSHLLAVGHRPAAFATAVGNTVAAGWLLALLVLHAYLSYNGLSTQEWIKGTGSQAARDEGAARPEDEEANNAPTRKLPTPRPRCRRRGADDWQRSMSLPPPGHSFEDFDDVITPSRRTISFMGEEMPTSWGHHIFFAGVDADHSPPADHEES